MVVVGSGIVGANVALEMARRGLSVLVLEAGPRLERWQVTENWRNLPLYSRTRADFQRPYTPAPGAPFPRWVPDNGYLALSGADGSAYKQGYLKVVGGTTWHWAAACWRHLPVDMRLQSAYGVGRDWPIAYAELEPYYCRAEAAIGVAGPSDPRPPMPPPFGPRPVDAEDGPAGLAIRSSSSRLARSIFSLRSHSSAVR